MSVLGIDFGNDSCYIAVARQGGIETIANDYSLRSTPACVAFGEKNRVLGVAAKNQMVHNMKNTCVNFKRLIAKNYRDPRVQEEIKHLPYKVFEEKDGSIGISVRYLNEEHTFSPPQITAMLFTKLKHTAEAALNIKVAEVVIGVPCYLDDAGRHAVIEAATAAGLNVLRLMNETAAVALAYGIYKQDLPAPEEKPRNVVFVDCGQSNFQVSAAAFNKGKLKMLMTTADEHLGGRDFDNLLARHFTAEFKSKYKVDAASNPRAMTRLLGEVEKLKKQMSANSTDLPMNIECFMNDKDVQGKMKRSAFEEMISSVLRRIENTLYRGLNESALRIDDIYSVEVVGGSSRIPVIKQLIEKVFKKVPSTTLNADEAVARGCALQCAMLSPTFKVRDFSITDVQPYSIKLLWSDEGGQEAEMEVFPKNHAVPFSKLLTFYRRESFTVQAQYAAPSPTPDPIIGHFTVKDVAPTANNENQKVKVKVRVNLHGLFTVASATLTEKKEVTEEEQAAQMEVEEKASSEENASSEPNKENTDGKENEVANDQKMDTEKGADEKCENGKGEKEGEKKTKKVSKTIELGITAEVRRLPQDKMNFLVEQEAKMVQNDKLENDRINAKNALEEYVYDMRGKIYDELEKYICESDRTSFGSMLDGTETWLYEDGEDCLKQVYIDKLAQLKKEGEPVKLRRREREELPVEFERLVSSVGRAQKAVDAFRQGEERLAHLDSAEVDKVEKAAAEKRSWADSNMGLLTSTQLDKDVPVTAGQVRDQRTCFEAVANPILNKPKPKPKVEDPPPPAPTEGAQSEEKPADPKTNGPASSEPSKQQEPMDVD